MPKQISDYTLEQLKSMAYDTLANIESYQADLKLLNSEILKRTQQIMNVPAPEVVKEVPKDAVKVKAEVKDAE